MKRLSIFSLAVALSYSAFAADAKPAVAATPKPTAPSQVTAPKTPQNAMILLYDSPSEKSKVIKQLQPTADLVAVFRQGDWVKVGDHADGATGWVNTKQYRDARDNYYQHYFQNQVQSFYMSTVKGKDGKTVVEAYQNGKKLSDAEAQKLYAQMQSQEKQQLQMMQRTSMEMHQALDHIFYPGIVVVEPVAKDEKAKQK